MHVFLLANFTKKEFVQAVDQLLIIRVEANNIKNKIISTRYCIYIWVVLTVTGIIYRTAMNDSGNEVIARVKFHYGLLTFFMYLEKRDHRESKDIRHISLFECIY